MDSMQSLDAHLPHSARSARQSSGQAPLQALSSPPPQPAPEAKLLADFKTAALSVTNLYKSAFSLQDFSHDLGYTAALNDLLHYLNSQGPASAPEEADGNVRRWIVARIEERARVGKHSRASPQNQESSRDEDRDLDKESDEDASDKDRDKGEPMKEDVASSPTPEDTSLSRRETTDLSKSTTSVSSGMETSIGGDGNNAFTFRYHHSPNRTNIPSNTSGTTTPIFVEVSAPSDAQTESTTLPLRSTRSQTNKRRAPRSAASRTIPPTIQLGSGAGQKRKFTFESFFDIGDGRESQGGGKRGRTS